MGDLMTILFITITITIVFIINEKMCLLKNSSNLLQVGQKVNITVL